VQPLTIHQALNPPQPLVGSPGKPEVSLYRVSDYSNSPQSINPNVNVTQESNSVVQFYFDTAPGNYAALVSFAKAGDCGANGHLIVLPGKSRNLVIATCHCITDWHARAAIAGALPVAGLSVNILTFPKREHCGDSVPSLSPRQERDELYHAEIDDGAYYSDLYAAL
jgi:hypothetical protein